MRFDVINFFFYLRFRNCRLSSTSVIYKSGFIEIQGSSKSIKGIYLMKKIIFYKLININLQILIHANNLYIRQVRILLVKSAYSIINLDCLQEGTCDL
jgi:hypothetical protein